MLGRYKIIEYYNGVIDVRNTVAFVDSLHYAILLVESLNKSCENPCYDYDFIKLDFKVDKNLDRVNDKVLKASFVIVGVYLNGTLTAQKLGAIVCLF